MPSVSKKQHKFMEAVAHSPSFAKKAGIPQSVGQDFSKADKGRKFSKGGDMAKFDPKSLFKGKESVGEELKEAKAIKSGKITPMQYAKGEKSEPVKKMAKGGIAKENMGPRTMSKDVEKGSNKLTKFGESAVQKRGHTKDIEEKMPKFARGGGIESRGKTKGRVC